MSKSKQMQQDKEKTATKITDGDIVEGDWVMVLWIFSLPLILNPVFSGLPDQFTPLSNLLPDFFRNGMSVWQQLKQHPSLTSLSN